MGSMSQPSTRTIYITALHYAVMTMTSIGYGDINPQMDSEYLVGISFQWAGSLFWAYGIGSICGIVANHDPGTTRFRQTMDELNHMMTKRCLPQEMRRRLRQYFCQARELHEREVYRYLLDQLSPSLQGEVARVTNERWLDKVWIFKGISDRLVVDIAKLLQG